jgi:hypothetical protein
MGQSTGWAEIGCGTTSVMQVIFGPIYIQQQWIGRSNCIDMYICAHQPGRPNKMLNLTAGKVGVHTVENDLATRALLPEYPSDIGVKVTSVGPVFILNSIPAYSTYTCLSALHTWNLRVHHCHR